jgi:hypothetical protein
MVGSFRNSHMRIVQHVRPCRRCFMAARVASTSALPRSFNPSSSAGKNAGFGHVRVNLVQAAEIEQFINTGEPPSAALAPKISQCASAPQWRSSHVPAPYPCSHRPRGQQHVVSIFIRGGFARSLGPAAKQAPHPTQSVASSANIFVVAEELANRRRICVEMIYLWL